MYVLVTSVALASLLGSMHCVGMCGPLASICIQPGMKRCSYHVIFMYHAGRLVSYSTLGALAGWLGASLQETSILLGAQRSVASIAGIVLATIGLLGLMRIASGQTLSFHPPQFLASLVAPVVRWLRKGSTANRSFALGVVTAALPCGWLYVFLLTAAATASLIWGALVMAAFSIGAIPLLSLAMLGGTWLGGRYRRLWPTTSALLLIVVGANTATHRSSIDLSTINTSVPKIQAVTADRNTTSATIEHITSVVLPCCQSVGKSVPTRPPGKSVEVSQ